MISVEETQTKYTKIIGAGENHNTMLKIGHQSFVVAHECDLETAEWFARQLSIALHRMMKEEIG